MVYPPDFADEPVVRDTKIVQSILEELFEVEQIKRYQGIIDQTSEEINNHSFEEIASVRDNEEKKDPDIEGMGLPELPDLAQYEAMIEWDNHPDEDDLTKHEKEFYNRIQDLEINEGGHGRILIHAPSAPANPHGAQIIAPHISVIQSPGDHNHAIIYNVPNALIIPKKSS